MLLPSSKKIIELNLQTHKFPAVYILAVGYGFKIVYLAGFTGFFKAPGLPCAINQIGAELDGVNQFGIVRPFFVNIIKPEVKKIKKRKPEESENLRVKTNIKSFKTGQ